MSFLIADAIAQPTAWMYWVARLPEIEKKPSLLRRIQHRHLAALQRIPLVGVDLAHHIDQRIAGGDQQSCLAIGRKIHVARQECLAESAADGLFAHVLHIERCLALPLRHQHPCVEGAQNHHVTQTPSNSSSLKRPAHGPTALPSRLRTRMIE